MACKGGRKKLLSFLLYAVTTQYALFSLPFFILGSDVIQRDVGFLKEKRRMNGMCRVRPILCLLFLSFLSGYDKGEAASCEFWSCISLSILIEYFSVLSGIPQLSAMGANISRNGWLGWTPMPM